MAATTGAGAWWGSQWLVPLPEASASNVNESQHGCWLGRGSMMANYGVSGSVIGVGSIPMRGFPQVVRVEGVGCGWGHEFQAVAERTV